jgi:CRISPR-associated protein Cst2
MSNLNLFATVLTYPAPAGNYRGESEENRSVIQKILKDGQKYAIISPESMRNALREMLIELGQPNNRTRLHNEDQLAVEFKEYPNPDKFADDFLFGYMVAQTNDAKKMKELNRPAKRDSILRCNMAVAVNPYKYDTVFYQSPLNAGDSAWKNSTSSALLHREVSHTAFQYPFALAGKDCAEKPEWVKALLQAIAELNGVAGGHARAYYEFAPRSVVARLTPKLVAGYQTYGFDAEGNWLELSRLTSVDTENADLPAKEFWLGGELVREMDEEQKAELKAMGTHLYVNPEKLFADLADSFMGA